MSLSVGSKASNKTKNYPSPQTFVKLGLSYQVLSSLAVKLMVLSQLQVLR